MAGSTIEVNTKVLTQILGATENLILFPTKKGTDILATANGAVARIKVPNLIIDKLKQPIEVATDTLVSASRGRDLNLSFSGHDIVLEKGSYNAKLAASEVATTPEFPSLEDATLSLELSDDAKAYLNLCLTATKIEKTFMGMQDILVYVRASASSILVASFEAYQVAFIKAKNKVEFPECEFVLPLSFVNKISNFPGQVVLTASESVASIESKAFKFVTPLSLETINAIPKEAIVGLIKTISTKENEVLVELPKASLDSFLANSKSVVTTGSEIVLSGDSKAVTLTVSTGRGTVKEKFKGSCSGSINLDFRFLQALSQKSKDTVTISRQQNFVTASNSGVTYVAALSEGG